MSAVSMTRRADPEFSDPRVMATATAIEEYGSDALGTFAQGAYRGMGPVYDSQGTVRVIKTAHVRRFELTREPEQFVTEDYATSNSRALIPQNSLIITSTGVGSAGRVFAHQSQEILFADNHITIVPLRDARHTAYLAAYLQSPYGYQQLLRLHRGSSRQIEIYPADVLSLQVPRLPDDAVTRIGEQWTKAVSDVRLARAGKAQADARLLQDTGISSYEVESPKSWSVPLMQLKRSGRVDAQAVEPAIAGLRSHLSKNGAVPLADLCLTIKKGLQPELYDPDGDIIVIKSKDVRFPGLDLDGCQRTSGINVEDCALNGGELLVNMTGEGTLGRSGVCPTPGDDQVLVPSVDVVAATVNRDIALPEYIAFFLNSNIGRRLSTAVQTGSSGQQHLYPVHFGLIPIPIRWLPSGQADLQWQRDVVAQADIEGRAISLAREAGAEMDSEFISALGHTVDLDTIPR
ncbi:restriction endonuclease subunit S [Kineococcus sp. SYSU DK018]|uniref:restriction endonuclease subunit S n=1 Tax=Kineococcus sp. SYSU DK018 TaxID=3383139 RepID=UPI003D7F019E